MNKVRFPLEIYLLMFILLSRSTWSKPFCFISHYLIDTLEWVKRMANYSINGATEIPLNICL
jgi:hypothetical protein